MISKDSISTKKIIKTEKSERDYRKCHCKETLKCFIETISTPVHIFLLAQLYLQK